MSEQEDDSQKTEEPTEHRLHKARLEGQFAVSREVNNWLVLLTITILIVGLFPYGSLQLTQKLGIFMRDATSYSFDEGTAGLNIVNLLFESLWPMLVVMLMLMLAGVAGTILQTGIQFLPNKLALDFNKLSLMEGINKMFRGQQVAEMVRNIIKLIVIGGISTATLWPMVKDIESYIGMELLQGVSQTQWLLVKMMFAIVATYTVLAFLDLLYEHWRFHQKMMMSKSEARQESKETQGDPHAKQRMAKIRHKRSKQRMLAAVPDASVIITNPTHFAVALAYDPDNMGAPKCLAKGVDSLALRIREAAADHDIPVVENPPLARALYASVDIDEEIPLEHYRAVAEIITYVFKLKRKTLKPKPITPPEP